MVKNVTEARGAARKHKAGKARPKIAKTKTPTGRVKDDRPEGIRSGRVGSSKSIATIDASWVTREPAPERTLCQESSGVSTAYVAGLNCLRPAKWLVQHRGHDPMAMCEGCADHNVKNRSARYLPKGEPYALYEQKRTELPVAGAEKALSTGEEASLKPPAMPTKLPLGDELRDYVETGMTKFHGYVEQELSKLLGADRPASELAHVYINFRDMHDRVTLTMKYLDQIKETLSEVTIPDTFKREGIKSFTTTSGWRVGTSLRLFASVIKAMKTGAFGWLRSNGLPDLIQETVHAGTLSSTAKDLLEAGKELPEEFFETHYRPNTSLTKVQVKK